MKTIYVVFAHGGQWEESWQRMEKAFTDEKAAQKYMEGCKEDNEVFVNRVQQIVKEFEESENESVGMRCRELEYYVEDKLPVFFSIKTVELEE